MPKPNITAYHKFIPDLNSFYDLFDRIGPTYNPHQTFQLLLPYEDLINITIVERDEWEKLHLPTLLSYISNSKFMQSYLIFTSDYQDLKEIDYEKLRKMLSIENGINTIFAANRQAAVKYAVGLLQKTALKGILDTREKPTIN